MSAGMILAIIALLCAVVDVLRPTPWLLNLGVACLAIALIV